MLTQHIGSDIAHFQVWSGAARTCLYDVRPLILWPPILVRAVRSDPAYLLVRAGGGGSGSSHCMHCVHYLVVWPVNGKWQF